MTERTLETYNPGAHWWLVLLEGIAAVILGILLFTSPVSTLMALVTFIGIYWLVTGVISVISPLWERRNWAWNILAGIIGIIAGLLILANPLVSAFLLPATYAIIIGVLGIIFGLSQLIHAFRGGGWGLGVLGVLSILLGILLVTRPVIAGISLAFMFGGLLLVGGILAIISAFSIRRWGEEYRERMEAESQARMGPRVGSAVPITGAQTGDDRAGSAAVGGAVVFSDMDVDTAPRGTTDTTRDVSGMPAGMVDEGVDTARRMGEDVSRDVQGGMDTARRTGEDVGRDVQRGVSDVTGQGMDAARRTGEDLGEAGKDVGRDVQRGVSDVTGQGMDAARRAGEDLGETAGQGMDAARRTADEFTADVKSGVSGVTDEGLDAARRMNKDFSGGVTTGGARTYDTGVGAPGITGEEITGETAALIGNVDPNDAQEMAKFRRPVEDIHDIGADYAAKLKVIGIHTCLDLIQVGSTAKGRNEIARKTGIDASVILGWVNHVDLYRIRGIGSEYANLLEVAGVDTVVELARRKPEHLFERITNVNRQQNLVDRMPTLAQVEDWTIQANQLPRQIEY